MRLLNVHTLKLHTFYGDAIPPYAILSHTWLQDAQEVTFSQLQADPVSWRNIEGSLKIDFLCQQAINDGYDYAWMDTCCIDKTNNSELSEAINSMFQWYQKSRVCYAYMADVEYGSEVDLMSSRWWSRAWTLQELLAPRDVKFYDTHWRLIGTKNDLSESIYSNTGINLETLRDPQCISESCVAQRMSWAAQRQATRTEDLAYSLLGIFGINMPLQYGEGKGAFVRLQQEILKTKNDQSLFAWGLSERSFEDVLHDFGSGEIDKRQIDSGQNIFTQHIKRSLSRLDGVTVHTQSGMFASHPRLYANCRNIEYHSHHVHNVDIDERHGFLTVVVPVTPGSYSVFGSRVIHIALLPCGVKDRPHEIIAMVISHESHGQFLRREFLDGTSTFFVNSRVSATAETKKIMVPRLFSMCHVCSDYVPRRRNRSLILEFHTRNSYSLDLPSLSSDWIWLPKESTLLQENSAKSHQLDLKFHSVLPATILQVVIHFAVDDSAEKQMVMISTQPSSTTNEKTTPSARKNTDEHPVTIGSFHHSDPPYKYFRCGTLDAKIGTHLIFNQAVTTLTITDHDEDTIEETDSENTIEETDSESTIEEKNYEDDSIQVHKHEADTTESKVTQIFKVLAAFNW